MRHQIGEKSLGVWLEFLSIADRNQGELPGDLEELLRSVAGKCQVTKSTARLVYEFALARLWVISDNVPRTRNHWKYHKSEEHKTEQKKSPPILSDPIRSEPLKIKNPDPVIRTPSADLLKMQNQKDEEDARKRKWDEKIKAEAGEIYATDKRKYMRLWEWVGQKRKSYEAEVVYNSLHLFKPYCEEPSISWWGYLEKIITKEEGKFNARAAELDSERHKAEDKETAELMFGRHGLR